jgi:hypothetical protein
MARPFLIRRFHRNEPVILLPQTVTAVKCDSPHRGATAAPHHATPTPVANGLAPGAKTGIDFVAAIRYVDRPPDGSARVIKGTAKEVRRLQPHKSGVIKVAFSPDGTRALTGTMDASVYLWDLATGHEIRRCEVTPATSSALLFPRPGIFSFPAAARMRTTRICSRRSGRTTAFDSGMRRARDSSGVATAMSATYRASRFRRMGDMCCGAVPTRASACGPFRPRDIRNGSDTAL